VGPDRVPPRPLKLRPPPSVRSPRRRRSVVLGVDRRIRLGVTVVTVVVVLAGAAAVWERVDHRGHVLSGVALDLPDAPAVAGLDRDDAAAALAAVAARVESEPTTWTAGELRFELDPTDVAVDVDVDATVDQLVATGRGWNPLAVVAGAALRQMRDDEVGLVVRWDDDALHAVVASWADDVVRRAAPGTVTLAGASVTIAPPPEGIALDVDATVDAIRAALSAAQLGDHPLVTVATPTEFAPDVVAAATQRAADLLRGPVDVVLGDESATLSREQLAAAAIVTVRAGALAVEFDPDALSEAIAEPIAALRVEPVDATWEVEGDGSTLRVVPAVAGEEVDVDALATALATGSRRIEATVHPVPAERTTEWATALGVTNRVSSFTTDHRSGEARVENIHRIADLTNLTVVLPGETYSLNGMVGPRTAEAGFVPAPSIEAGEFEETYGGGVSQYATTLYNAVYFGGYRIDEHTPHSYYFERYPQGREATIAWPSIDLVFTNDSETAILIVNQYGSGSITVSLYGDNGGRDVDSTTEVLEEIPFEVEEEDEPELPEGEQEITSYGIAGSVVRVTRTITYPDGTVVEDRYTTHYRAKPTVVAVGTGTTTTTVEETTTTTAAPPSSSPTSTPTTEPATTTTPPATGAPGEPPT
jgi:vancomycin resistance protein YoaR